MANALSLFAGRDALAGYTKEDQQTYNELFAPQMMSLREIGLGMGAGNVFDAANRGVETAGRTFDATLGSFARDRERAGLATDGASAASQGRRLSLQRVIQQVDAGNRGSRNAKAAQRTAQAWGMQTFGDASASANQTLAQIAQSEADRDAQYRQARAQNRAGLTQMAGAGLGLAASFLI